MPLYENWAFEAPDLPEFPAKKLRRLCDPDPAFAGAARCFFLFRYLHRSGGSAAALLGDWYFSCFSRELIALDSLELTEAFAGLLQQDSLNPLTFEEYLSALGELKAVSGLA